MTTPRSDPTPSEEQIAAATDWCAAPSRNLALGDAVSLAYLLASREARLRGALEQAAADLHSECGSLGCWEPCKRAREALRGDRERGEPTAPPAPPSPA